MDLSSEQLLKIVQYSFLQALEILSKILKIEGRRVTIESDLITVQLTDCENQRSIAKAGIADCGIATVQSYQGLAKGLFGKEMDVLVRHTKNLNRGDGCCEVAVSRNPQRSSERM